MRVDRDIRARLNFPRAAFAVLTALILSATVTAAASRSTKPFREVNLGTLGGFYSAALAVNARGVVVGRSSIENYENIHYAFRWSKRSGMRALASLGGSRSWASLINDEGLIAGISYLPGDFEYRAVVWSDSGDIIDLGTLGGFASSVTAMNAKGAVVGSSYLPDNTFHAYIWTPTGGMVDLGTLGGQFSTAYAINDSGVVVGTASVAGTGATHAFLWTPDTGMIDLGGLSDDLSSWAHAITEDGVVFGNSQTATGENHAFRWTRRTGMVDIGNAGFNSWAERVGRRKIAIGQGYTPDGTKHGMVWTRTGSRPTDIGTLGGNSSFARAVSDQGLVVGGSWTGGNELWRAFVWSEQHGIVPLASASAGKSEAAAISGNVIAGFTCAEDNVTCQATLWRPMRPRHR